MSHRHPNSSFCHWIVFTLKLYYNVILLSFFVSFLINTIEIILKCVIYVFLPDFPLFLYQNHILMAFNYLAAEFKERRKSLKITQPKLADLAKVSVNTLLQLEQEEGNPTLETMTKVADVLGLKLTLQVRQLTNAS